MMTDVIDSVLRAACLERGLDPSGVCQVAAAALEQGRLPEQLGVIAPDAHVVPDYVAVLQRLGFLYPDGCVDEAVYREHSQRAYAERHAGEQVTTQS